MSPDDLARALARPGRASIPYRDRYSSDRLLMMECFRPQGHNPDKPVVIVQHGASRNGAEYCEAHGERARAAGRGRRARRPRNGALVNSTLRVPKIALPLQPE
jgi:hypothetical protein